MQIKSILSCVLGFAMITAPFAEAAPNKKKNNKPAAPSQQKKEVRANFPAQYEADYQKFITKLRELTKSNSFDLSPALFIILRATNDEFSIEPWMQRAADEGEPAAILFMAQKNLINIPEEHYRAPEILTTVTQIKKAADRKYVPAIVAYSQCLDKGIGVFPNHAAAERLLIEACSSGCFRTRFEWLRQTGRLEKFEDLQRPEVKAEVERGNHYILHHVSLMAPDHKTMLKLLVQAANKGNGYARYELSEFYAQFDIARSYKILALAVKARNPDALYRMGMYLINPPATLEINVGPIRNTAEGVVMLKMASIVGQNDARLQLARMYMDGKNGLEKDPIKAYRHITTGAIMSGAPALLAAQGFMMLQGIGTNKDTETGLKLIQAAASRGYTHAKSLLGYIYYHGIGVDKNLSTAVMHLEDAAAHKDPIAFIYLALMFDADNQPEKVQYYLERAERTLHDKANTIFNYYKQNFNGWFMKPFPI